MIAPEKSVDVAIQVYGKPQQTLVTLASLLKHSHSWIRSIYLIEERRQPEPLDLRAVQQLLTPEVTLIRYRPKYFFGVETMKALWRLRFRDYRWSCRYQYAWESTEQPFLFLTHNDVYYKADLIGKYMNSIGGAIAIGMVGQCWNCEAHYAGVCVPERQRDYRPTAAEAAALMALPRKGPRHERYASLDFDWSQPWPLPECRLNEFAALINMNIARAISYPQGPVLPFGAMIDLDVGARWFRQVCQLGHEVRHFDFSQFASHAWAVPGRSGFEADSDRGLYAAAEARAAAVLRDEFPKNSEHR